MSNIEYAEFKLRKAQERMDFARNVCLGIGIASILHGTVTWFGTGQWEPLFHVSTEELMGLAVATGVLFYWLDEQVKNASEYLDHCLNRR